MSRLVVGLTVAAVIAAVAAVSSGAALAASGDTYVQVAKLTGNSERSTAALVPSSSNFDTLGTSVAVSGNGNVLAVGAPGVSRVYVFVRPSNGAWKDAHETVALFPYASQDSLGTSVAVSSDGKTIVAGAPGDNGTAGAVYVYTEPPGGWKESSGAPTLMLIGYQGAAGDYLGASVATDAAGNAIVAGAPGWSGGEGAIYLFTEHSGGWRSGWTGVVPGAGVWANVGESGGNSAYGGDFGQSVAMSASADTIAVGAPFQDGWEGAVYVFERSHGQYAGYRELPDTASGTADNYFICSPNSGYGIGNPELGTSVSISSGGHTIAAGEPCAGTGGQAVVYTEPSHGWFDATGQITAGLTPLRPQVFDIQQYGYAVAISGSADAVLADDPSYTATSGGYVGWTLVPTRGWGHVNPPDASDFGSIFNQTPLAGGAYDLTAGDPIAISTYAGSIFVGGTGHDNEGAVYVYNEISRGATPTTVSCSPSAVTVGKPSSCKVTASDAGGGSRQPTGTVSLSSNGGSSGDLSSKSCTLKSVKGHSGRGDCSFTFTPESPLAYTITAHYGGDLHHHSGSATTVVSTTRRTTSTAVSCAPASVQVAVASQCTATATGVGTTPPATIDFKVATGLLSGEVCTPAAGMQTCTIAFSAGATGSYKIGAAYAGNAQSAPSSASTTVTVTTHPTLTAVSCTGVTHWVCTVTVTDTSSAATPPSGTVTFTASKAPTAGGSCPLAPQSGSSDVSTCAVDYVPGTDVPVTFTANYPGDSTHAASSNSTVHLG